MDYNHWNQAHSCHLFDFQSLIHKQQANQLNKRSHGDKPTPPPPRCKPRNMKTKPVACDDAPTPIFNKGVYRELAIWILYGISSNHLYILFRIKIKKTFKANLKTHLPLQNSNLLLINKRKRVDRPSFNSENDVASCSNYKDML